MEQELSNPKITAQDIILPPFRRVRNEPPPRNQPFSDSGKETNEQMVAFDNFLSTPYFIK